MSIKFTKPTSRAGWASMLEDIIAAGRAAMQDTDPDTRRTDLTAANTALGKFIDAFDDSDFWTHDLDHAAREALGYLVVDFATLTAEDIASRTDSLRQIANTVNATASDNEKAAAGIRHDALVQALTSAMNAAKAAKELQTAVKDNADDGKLADAAQKLLEAISKFKDVAGSTDS